MRANSFIRNILHEAGHIAVFDPARRQESKFSPSKGEELGALAWSYAAVVLSLKSELVFYPCCFSGWAIALTEHFAECLYVGLPLLHRYGLAEQTHLSFGLGVEPYPHMLRWLR